MATAETIRVVILNPDTIKFDNPRQMYAAKQCYAKQFAGDIVYSELDPRECSDWVMNTLVKSGHDGVLEHAHVQYAIEGFSRSSSHQKVRHRLESFLQQSQYFTEQKNLTYRIHELAAKYPEVKTRYVQHMHSCENAYNDILNMLEERNVPTKKARGCAREVLPNAATTKMVVTSNYRSLMHFMGLRKCVRAETQIRQIANDLFNQLQVLDPIIFNEQYFGARCEKTQICPEGTHGCGKYPTADEAIRLMNIGRAREAELAAWDANYKAQQEKK